MRFEARSSDGVKPDTIRVQRKCACGAKSSGDGHCSSCGQSRDELSSPPRQLSGSNGQPLDRDTATSMGSRFNSDFSSVRVHDNAASHLAARDLSARAFTVGRDIYFAKGEYDASSAHGSKLLAHELSHSIQQFIPADHASGQAIFKDEVSETALEAEADRAAESVASGRSASVSRGVVAASPLRQKAGPAPAQPKVVQPVDPNKQQQKMIDDARRAAAIRTQRAGFKARGIEGALDFMEARRLAQIKFDWPDPNMDQVAEIMGNMGGLIPTVSIKVAGAGDPECGNRGGYVRGHRAPIILCPPYFTSTPEERTRTIVHEAAHVVGIGSADASEQYFVTFDCDSKGDFSAADSWANYVNCLSGQPPDKPMAIQGKAGGAAPNPSSQSQPKSGTKP